MITMLPRYISTSLNSSPKRPFKTYYHFWSVMNYYSLKYCLINLFFNHFLVGICFKAWTIWMWYRWNPLHLIIQCRYWRESGCSWEYALWLIWGFSTIISKTLILLLRFVAVLALDFFTGGPVSSQSWYTSLLEILSAEALLFRKGCLYKWATDEAFLLYSP